MASNLETTFSYVPYVMQNMISIKFVSDGKIDDLSAFVQKMNPCLAGDRPLPELPLTMFIDAYMCRHATIS